MSGKNSNTQVYSIYNTKHQNSLRKTIRFELISFYGGLFLNRKPKLFGNSHLLHLGCATNKFEGWTNADFYRGLRFWKKDRTKLEWRLDLRYPMNCDDDIWDGVFCEHTLEHLYPLQVLNLLKELYRSMKPKAFIRVTVPDLKKYVDYYNGNLPHENFSRWETGCEAIRSVTQNWTHLSVWDSHLLGRFFKEAGFRNVKETEHMTGSDKRLLRDRPENKWETLYMEAQK